MLYLHYYIHSHIERLLKWTLFYTFTLFYTLNSWLIKTRFIDVLLVNSLYIYLCVCVCAERFPCTLTRAPCLLAIKWRRKHWRWVEMNRSGSVSVWLNVSFCDVIVCFCRCFSWFDSMRIVFLQFSYSHISFACRFACVFICIDYVWRNLLNLIFKMFTHLICFIKQLQYI